MTVILRQRYAQIADELQSEYLSSLTVPC